MKKHYIFIAIAIFSSIIFFSVPQFSGTVFVDNSEDQQPADWLSAIVYKYKEQDEQQYHIPDHIRHIKISGAGERLGNIHVFQDTHQSIINTKNNNTYEAQISIHKDTLIIPNGAALPGLKLNIDSRIKNLIFSAAKDAELHIHHRLPLEISVEDQSKIYMRCNRNIALNKINVSDQSTFTLSHCFTPVIDIQVDNSMLYVERFNHIDSLKVNLIGKSNVKRISSQVIDADEEVLLKEFNIKSQHLFIYPTGNLKYYNLTNPHL